MRISEGWPVEIILDVDRPPLPEIVRRMVHAGNAVDLMILYLDHGRFRDYLRFRRELGKVKGWSLYLEDWLNGLTEDPSPSRLVRRCIDALAKARSEAE